MRIRNRILALGASLMLAVGALAIDLSNPATADAASCSEAALTVWTNQNFGGAGLVICFDNNIANLGTILNGTFNNSISSAQLDAKSVGNAKVCLYDEANYNPNPLSWEYQLGPGDSSVSWNWWNNGNDKTTSIRWGNC